MNEDAVVAAVARFGAAKVIKEAQWYAKNSKDPKVREAANKVILRVLELES